MHLISMRKIDIKKYYMLFQIQDRNPLTKDMHPTAISIASKSINFLSLRLTILFGYICLWLLTLSLRDRFTGQPGVLGADSGMRPEQVRSWFGVELTEYAEEGNG